MSRRGNLAKTAPTMPTTMVPVVATMISNVAIDITPHEVLIASVMLAIHLPIATKTLLLAGDDRGTQNHKVDTEDDNEDAHGNADVCIDPSIGCATTYYCAVQGVKSNGNGDHHCKQIAREEVTAHPQAGGYEDGTNNIQDVTYQCNHCLLLHLPQSIYNSHREKNQNFEGRYRISRYLAT